VDEQASPDVMGLLRTNTKYQQRLRNAMKNRTDEIWTALGDFINERSVA
jgi:hypothetical protein